jgi:Asp-tRNA(Asn)/Glu-tRNA(Gln) amidotransferase B subunit
VTASDFGKLCGLLETNKINAADLKKALDELWTEKSNVDEIVSKIGARQSLDHETLKQICLRIVDENPKNVASYKAGKTNLLGWFMGQVMKETNDCIIELISK